MEITSPAFKHNGLIPAEYTCDGENVSPELEIKDIPSSAKSIALICDDLDSPGGSFVHWIACDIIPTSKINKGRSPGISGKNTYGELGFGGPCPPSGTHRYVFTVYALDQLLNLREGFVKKQLLEVIKGHILEKCELAGLYKRP